MIELSERCGVTIVTMMHGKANALDIEFCEAIAAEFDRLRDAPAKAAVLTGRGRIFSAGVDLVQLSAGGAPYVRRFLPALHRLYEAVFFFPKPVVAAVNGHAIAGGCVLQCCADKRIAAKDGGHIGVTELLVGVPFPALPFEIMRATTPPRYLADGMLSGATFAPDVARTRGLVDELVDASSLLNRAIAAAQTMAALSPKAFAQTKQQIRQPVLDALERHGKRIDIDAMEIWAAPDTLARIKDYVSKTFKKA
jgi:enoyl-CoA hydratase